MPASASNPLQWQPLPSGPLLRPGTEDARVPELTRRLVSEGYLNAMPLTVDHHYDNELVAAVKSFRRCSLQADGVVGAGTLKN